MTLTKDELGLLGLALMKCHTLQEIVQSKKFKLCVIAKENIPLAAQKGYITMALPFGFPETSDEELMELLTKVEEEEKIAWLKENRK